MNNNTNRIYTPIVFAIALIIGVALLRPAYTNYMDARTEQASSVRIQAERQKELTALTDLQASFSSSGTTALTERVKKLNKKWNEAAVMSEVMLTEFTKWSEFVWAPILISSISLDKGKKLPSGLSLGSVKLSVTWRSVDDVINFLTYLTTASSYVFTLDSISLPISAPVQKETDWVSLSLDLGVYYYE